VYDDPVHDFGVVEDTATVSHVFMLRNAGDEMLSISGVTTCCGGSVNFANIESQTSDAKLRTSCEIAPGESAALTLSLVLKGRSGPQEKSFYVASDDPAQPFHRLCLKGHVAAKVALSAATVFLKATSEQDAVTGTITVTLAPGIPHPTNVTAEVSWLDTRIEHVGAQAKVIFTALPKPPRPSGTPPEGNETGTLPKGISRTTAQLYFPEGAPYPHIDIPVTLYVPQEIAVLPPDIVLPHNPSVSVQRNATLRSPSRPFKILEVRYPDPSWTSELRSTDGKVWRIKFDGLRTGSLPGNPEIIIRTDHPDCPELVIQVRVEE